MITFNIMHANDIFVKHMYAYVNNIYIHTTNINGNNGIISINIYTLIIF